MKRTRIRLTESDLHRIIKESVKRVINEIEDTTVARASGNAGLKANNPQYFYQGKSPEYIQRKQRQADYLRKQTQQRRTDFANGGYGSITMPEYDRKMARASLDGQDAAYRQAGRVPPTRKNDPRIFPRQR